MSQSFDLQAVLAVQNAILSSPVLTGASIFFARWLVFLEAGIIPFLYLTKEKTKQKVAILAVVSGGFAYGLTALIGHFILRTRPFLAFKEVALLVPAPLKTSFPSGHTTIAFAMAFAIASGSKPLGAVAFVCAILVAFGRVAVGVHYPTDLLGGVLVGLLGFVLVRAAYRDIWVGWILKMKAEREPT